MNDLVKVNNQDLQVKEFKGQRVVTFKDIDLLHERVEGTAGRNFRENRKHFIEGTDYFQRNSSEAKNEFNTIAPNGLILITESGYLMLVKSFQDDLAWKVQRELVNSYFRVKEITKQLTPMELLDLQYKVLKEQGQKIDIIDSKVETLSLTMNISDGQAKTIQALVHKRVKTLCYGSESPAYSNESLRKKVYRYIWKTLKDYLNVTVYHNILRKDYSAALKYIDNITLQGALLREVQDANSQIGMEVMS